jgi:prolipoprotein diacylglyceryltransferase
MGQNLSIPFVLLGIYLIYNAYKKQKTKNEEA